MGFTRTSQELDRYYRVRERQFIGARMLGVMFQTSEAIARGLIPPPLEPADAPTGLMFIAQYPETNLGPGYREAALFIHCRYRGETGSYCLSMPIQSEALRLYNGRDIFGFPKKMANIHLAEDGQRIHGWVERHGTRFVEIEAQLIGELPELPAMGPTFLFKASPRIDLTPGFDGPVLLCRHRTEIKLQKLSVGTAALRLMASPHDPWSDLGDPQVLAAFYLISDNTMLPGRVLTEVDPDAYLPYYFKMTDYFAGE